MLVYSVVQMDVQKLFHVISDGSGCARTVAGFSLISDGCISVSYDIV